MRKRTFQNQNSPQPEEQLRFLSMTEDFDDRFAQEKIPQCKWDIEPWKNQHENPSQSPQRRPYFQRPSPAVIKFQKPLQIKLMKASTKVLESTNNSNISFRVKTSNKRNSTITQKTSQTKFQIGVQSQNRPSTTSRPPTFRRKHSVSKPSYKNDYDEKSDCQQESSSSFHKQVNPIVYPMVTDNKKKRLFRKMDKFQNFVSVSLRK